MRQVREVRMNKTTATITASFSPSLSLPPRYLLFHFFPVFPFISVISSVSYWFSSMMCRYLNIRSVQMLSNFWTKFVLVSKYFLFFAVQHLVFHKLISLLSQDSDGLQAGWTGFESHQGQDFSPLHNIQTSYGCPPSRLPIQWAPGVKRLQHEADRSPPSGAEVKNDGAIPPLPYRDKFTILPLLNSVS
jgi:hypothetical protein